jgi:glycosidase
MNSKFKYFSKRKVRKVMWNALFAGALIISMGSCKYATHTGEQSEKKHVVESKVVHPEWAENAVIYEVNVRQYTPEGTFKAFCSHLPRLKELGVDILWLMPVNPIGELNRKGSLGSYYAVKDYRKINREYGTIADLTDLVKQAHALNMHVIIDWVGNHTSWDNAMFTEHPDWYKRDSLGKPISPMNWTDVVQLNYDNPELFSYMINSLKFWVNETGIDGYRCDVAGMIPCNFWDSARIELDKIKPVFMLAEDEAKNCLVEKAFDMNYAWGLLHHMNDIPKGKADADTLRKYFEKQDSLYNPSIYRMNFLTNHDENTWSGTEFDRLGDGVNAFAILTFTVPGMPLIYSGQEVGMHKKLRFFDKDTISWTDTSWTPVYKKLVSLRKGHSVFWGGTAGGSFKMIDIKENKNVFAFYRENQKERAIVLLNLSDKTADFKLTSKKIKGSYTDFFGSETVSTKSEIQLPAYGYLVLLKDL